MGLHTFETSVKWSVAPLTVVFFNGAHQVAGRAATYLFVLVRNENKFSTRVNLQTLTQTFMNT